MTLIGNRTWIANEDPDWEISYVTERIRVKKLKRAAVVYRVEARSSGGNWVDVQPHPSENIAMNHRDNDDEIDGSIYYANDAFKLAGQFSKFVAGEAGQS